MTGPTRCKPNLGFTQWVRAIEYELGRELDSKEWLFAAKLYEAGLPWPEAITQTRSKEV